MTDPLTLFIIVFGTLFVVVDPPGNVPFYLMITQGYSKKDKKNVIYKAITTATLILIIFGLVGQYIFALFTITIPAFQIAGGILLFTIGFDMLSGMYPRTKQTSDERQEAIEKFAVGVVPLGIPMISGPGAITATMIYVAQTSDLIGLGIIIVAILAVMAINFILLLTADSVFGFLGKTGTLAMMRIMGLLLAAIAVQFVVQGTLTIATEWYTSTVL